MKSKFNVWTGVVSCLSLLAVAGETVGQTESDASIEEIVVRSHPLSAEGLSQPVIVLSGDALNKALATSIGETLSVIPGVHSASFGPAVGRPVIRGLSGPRVKIMEDRIDSLDVSVSSPDHVTTIEPFIAKSIEVFKGPSTLLYGSGAIGGVVDIHTGRIPHAIPDGLSADLEVKGSDNADQRSGAARIEGGAGAFAFHADGFYRDADEYDIPGYAESALYRANEEHGDEHHDDDHDEGHDDDHDEDHEEHEGEEEAFGTLPGSQMKVKGGSFGLSFVGDTGFFGVAVSTYEGDYGLPGHSHHHDEEHGDEHGDEHEDDHDEDEHDEEEHDEHEEHGEDEMPPILELEQTRIDIEGGVEAPFAGIRSLNVRMGYNDYEHTEVEGDEGGTQFKTEASEARIEATHHQILGFEGAAGLQASNREFSALGEEAFVPPVDTQSFGVFWVGQKSIGDVNLETGLRYEKVEHDPTEGPSRDFNLGSASLGMIIPLADSWTLSGQVDYSNRAPIAEELYSNGPHLATQTFEIGDASLDEETAKNISANLRYSSGRVNFALGAFSTDSDNFIYEANTGLEEDELPVLQWSQGDAKITGMEAEASWTAMTWSDGALTLSAAYDLVEARLDEGSNRNLPRIPPQRWTLTGNFTQGPFQAEASWRTVSSQSDVAANELSTESYDDLRLYVSYALDFGSTNVDLFVNGLNLTDEEQRLHTSFIAQMAPRPGRTIEAGFRIHM